MPIFRLDFSSFTLRRTDLKDSRSKPKASSSSLILSISLSLSLQLWPIFTAGPISFGRRITKTVEKELWDGISKEPNAICCCAVMNGEIDFWPVGFSTEDGRLRDLAAITQTSVSLSASRGFSVWSCAATPRLAFTGLACTCWRVERSVWPIVCCRLAVGTRKEEGTGTTPGRRDESKNANSSTPSCSAAKECGRPRDHQGGRPHYSATPNPSQTPSI